MISFQNFPTKVDWSAQTGNHIPEKTYSDCVGNVMIGKYKFIFLVAIFISLLGCTEVGNICATGNRLAIQSSELKQALIMEMKKERIDFEENKFGEICYPANKKDFVHSTLIKLDIQQRSSNQITISSGAFALEAFKQMEEAGIEFIHLEEGSEIVIVVEQESDLPETKDILYRVAKRMFSPENRE